MGQARRRRQQLGSLYGTPEGSNQKLKVFAGSDQSELDQKALKEIVVAKANDQPVILIGTQQAQPLVSAAGLDWLHEIPKGQPIPKSFAWDLENAEKTGIVPPAEQAGAVVILAAGSIRMLEKAILDGLI